MLGRLTVKEQRAVWLLALIGFVSRAVLMFRSDARIASRPYIEDAFYAFSCARQLAIGNGFSIDGTHPTNGVQPLICLLYAPCFLFTHDKWLGLRLTFLVTGIIAALGTVLVAHLLSELRTSQKEVGVIGSSPIIGALLWVALAPLMIHNANGLETGLNATLLLGAVAYYHHLLRDGYTYGRSVVFGALLGLLVLSRIDAVFFIAAVSLYELFRDAKGTLKYILIFGLTSIAISAPWWLYNYTTFGSFMPISGQSEALGSQVTNNLLQSAATLGDMLGVFYYRSFYAVPLIVNIVIPLFWLLVWMLIFRKTSVLQDLRREHDLRALVPLAFFGVTLFVYYNFFFNAPHFLSRYLHPVRVLWLLLFSLLLPGINQVVLQRSRVVRVTASIVLVLAIGFNFQRYVNNFTTTIMSDLYQAGMWASQHPAERVGMDQSGTANFVSPNVINLDGKVNAEVLRFRQLHQKGAYLSAQRFEYLADWGAFANDLVASAEQYGLRYMPVDSFGQVKVYQLVQSPVTSR